MQVSWGGGVNIMSEKGRAACRSQSLQPASSRSVARTFAFMQSTLPALMPDVPCTESPCSDIAMAQAYPRIPN